MTLENSKTCRHSSKFLALSTQELPDRLAQRSETIKLIDAISEFKPNSFFKTSKEEKLIKSSSKNRTFSKGFIGKRSMATIFEDGPENCVSTCDQLPGAAPKSIIFEFCARAVKEICGNFSII